MQAWGLTDPGMVRSQNQDHYAIVKLGRDQLLAIICDGMGGARSGNIASQMAVEVFVEEVKRTTRANMKPDRIDNMLEQALEMANEAVYEQSQLSEEYRGMGTTLVAAFFQKDQLTVANVGDSRAYLFNKDGVKSITTDHSLVELMVQRGEITREAAKFHPGKNLITRAVGTEAKVSCDLYHLKLNKGDSVLLCSDGLSNVMSDQEILFEVIHGVNKNDCCQRLMNIANYRGSPDNVTVALIAI
ncbi:MAG TPA: Stp1/IreP family PP2C-type Ser/Thr phosphatase [Candidatus Avoscillospira stercoripullorum]|uniref:Stp1/IreP family PP2C-type Ser/Thr phosphatase n=1 Tax=Candidatus Avoscillospira stercoripullorum TaxID=2840709 RepID=A0A9D1A6Z3_9FIRM|nr:Stp1/IreP family PP2C-type Ser/Thr phosphatase [Candidatus Avoscillospira stercoripullorum]